MIKAALLLSYTPVRLGNAGPWQKKTSTNEFSFSNIHLDLFAWILGY
jgi:hypothetical protein